MMHELFHTLSDDNAATRSMLYRGVIFQLPANSTTVQLVEHVHALFREYLGDGPPREAQFRMGDETFFERIGALRKKLYTEPQYHDVVRQLLVEHGFAPAEHAFDPMRLRVITHGGHENRRAAPIYYGHRDTWYANPQTQITWSIPLHEIDEGYSYEFYPEYFAEPVANDSQLFDHDDWVRRDKSRKIGWQKRDTGLQAAYPQLMQEVAPCVRVPVVAKGGELILFSGQHLHRTQRNVTGRTRFSIDFRTVHLDDERCGRAPANVDNRSTGSALGDHIHPDAAVKGAAE